MPASGTRHPIHRGAQPPRRTTSPRSILEGARTMARLRLGACGIFACLLLAGVAAAQADVIVGDLTTPDNYGSENNIAAFAFGTVSCNIGSVPLQWQANTQLHPVIGQNMF